MYPNYPGGHGAYQDFVVRQLRDHYADPAQLPSGLLDIAERFWQKDLTGVNTLMRDVYSPFGPRPRPVCCMLLSYLLSIALHFSVTKWVDQMRTVPAYAILSGFAFGDTPGVGTFADFFTRLWQYSEQNFSSHQHPPKLKVTKPKKKGEKAAPVERITVSELLAQLEENPPAQQQPFSSRCFSRNFGMSPWTEGCLPPPHWHFPVMALPLSPPLSSARNGCATAKSVAFPPVTATDITPSQTAISAGTPAGAVSTTAMTFICSLPPTLKMTCRYFRCFNPLPATTPTVSSSASSP